MPDAIRRWHPFRTAEARRLAALFIVVYFAQGMWYLPNQTIAIVFKDAGLTAGRIADFFAIGTVAWNIKPVYGLLSDFLPLFRRRRISYFLVTSSMAAAAGAAVALSGVRGWGPLLVLFTAMGLGLAFTDVLADALMVEHGRRLGLTGALQSAQWAAIQVSSILVGVGGGWLAERRSLGAAFLIAAVFPLLSLAMTAAVVREEPARTDLAALRERLLAMRDALADRHVWVVAGFIFFFMFSPSFGPGFLFYQTDRLHFSQQFIGALGALQSIGSVLGALAYPALARRLPLRRALAGAIGLSAAGTLVYLLYRGPWSAVAIDFTYGWVYMVTNLAFLDLAAKSCPPRVEGTFFALLMSVSNLGSQGAEWTGGHLYDLIGFERLVLVSTAATLLSWTFVPLVHAEAIEAKVRAESAAAAGGATEASDPRSAP
jgi:predicted MFS family arabinose efflux permease